MSKSREIYILAANYMQNIDWVPGSDLARTIILFYSKAEAYESLSDFYESCAQTEINEYRDYPKVSYLSRPL